LPASAVQTGMRRATVFLVAGIFLLNAGIFLLNAGI
jgi:hypothetical protein